MGLKEATWEHHKAAERQEFVSKMFKGELSDKEYATFCYNQILQYQALEVTADTHGVIKDMPDIIRHQLINKDYYELWDADTPPPVLNVTKEFVDYIYGLDGDKCRLMAHIYTRHMGDLMGGQMLKKCTPGSSQWHTFDDPDTLKMRIREEIGECMGSEKIVDEVKVAYEFATKTFEEMLTL